MSTLTKVFVVLLVVFSIAFTMSVISFVVQTTDWRQLASDYREEQQVIAAHMRNLSASHAAEKSAWLDVRQDLERRITSLESEKLDLGQQIAALGTDVAAATAEKKNDEALARKLAGELKVAQDGWTEQHRQRNALEEQKTNLERRNLDLNERVSELTAQLLVVTQAQKQLEQQIHILRTENEKLAQGVPAPAAGVAPAGPSLKGIAPLTEAAVSPIRGRMLEVSGDLASVSVGSADGVESGMVFVIYRGSEYIGDLEVTNVEPNQSAGRITRSRRAPQAGDSVADETRFGLAE